jgi:hypothetical protein
MGDVAPVHLSERAREFWEAVVTQYDRLEVQHFELLRRCCEAMDVADQARGEWPNMAG